MPRTFSQDDYKVSQYYNHQILIETDFYLAEKHLFATNVFSKPYIQTVTIPLNMSELDWALGGLGEFVAGTAFAHAIEPAPGVTINGAASAVTFSTTPFSETVMLRRVGINDWFAYVIGSSSAPPVTVYSGAMVRLNGNQNTLANLDTPTTVAFDTIDYDEGDYFDISAPTILTVPAGVNYVNLSGGVTTDGNIGSNYLSIMKNGTEYVAGQSLPSFAAAPSPRHNVSVIGVPVEEGDTFSLRVGSTIIRNLSSIGLTYPVTPTFLSIQKAG